MPISCIRAIYNYSFDHFQGLNTEDLGMNASISPMAPTAITNHAVDNTPGRRIRSSSKAEMETQIIRLVALRTG